MDDKLRFVCSCGKTLAADPKAAGKKARFPSCGQMVQIPLPPEPGLVLAPPPLPPTRRSASIPQSPPPPPPSPPAAKSIWDEEDEYRVPDLPTVPCPKCAASMPPEAVVCIACGYNRQTGTSATASIARPAAPKRASPFAWLRRKPRAGNNLLVRLALFPLVFGVVFFMLGLNEKKLADASSQAPETISLKKLIDRGPEGNPNVILTDFQLCDNLVYETSSIAGQAVGSWSSVWVPIVPRDALAIGRLGAAAPPRDIQAIIFSKHVSNVQEVTPKLGVQQLRGMVTNRISSLNSKEKQFLQKGYPGINFDRCLIIDEGREPSSSERISLYLGGGGLLVLIGVGLMAKRFLLG